MSDFDREAERERLREKYEQDKKERESTERMSELLLQGATMTNAHCSQCGDPVFRYDGQEFCATCERPVDRQGGADSGGDESGDTGEETEAQSVEVTSPDENTRVVFGDEGDGSGDDVTPERETADSSRRQTPPTDGHQTTDKDQQTPSTDGQRTAPGAEGRHDGERDPVAPADTSREHYDEGGVETARASLVRTLAASSRRAEAAGDPQRAREHLETAREAAEALAALRR